MSTDASSPPDDSALLKALLLRERETFAAAQERFDRERKQHAEAIAHYEQMVQSQLRTIEQQQHPTGQAAQEAERSAAGVD